MTETLVTIETALKLAGCSADESRPHGRIYNVLSKHVGKLSSTQRINKNVAVAPSEVAEWLRFYRPADTPKMRVKVFYVDGDARETLKAMAHDLGAISPAEIVQWWLDGKVTVALNE